MTEPLANYRPGGYYYRRAYREAESADEQAEIFETLLLDHEKLREWVRDQGLRPPKFEVLSHEVDDKPWLLMPAFPGAQLELGLPEPEHPGQGELLLFAPACAVSLQPTSGG